MFEQLNKELVEIKEKLRVRQKLISNLDRTQNMLGEQSSKLKKLESVLEKEGADVKKLEGLSLAGLFHSVLGDKQAQLEKERQEYLAAKLKYDECKYSISALGSDIDSIKIRIAGLGDLDGRYRSVVEKKEQLISQSNSKNTSKLIELSEALADTQSDIREFNEAIGAGKAVLTVLDEVVNSLKSARNWGTFDMLGGGLITTAVKHSRINKVRELVHQVQQQLRIFQRELADVNSMTEIKIDIGSFVTFADYFFDGLIVDWIVQSKIVKSLESAVQVSERVRNILGQLRSDLKKSQDKSRDLKRQKQKIIEDAV
ncbi:MAG: hypothetical protein JW715_09635 [Sedimentisphaerales bacterium]|nr:hypothetical protein [Sedimentisphaerales bacterium]